MNIKFEFLIKLQSIILVRYFAYETETICFNQFKINVLILFISVNCIIIILKLADPKFTLYNYYKLKYAQN